MEFNLEKIYQDSNSDFDLMLQLYTYDLNQDGVLSDVDLKIFFGETVASEFGEAFEKAIKEERSLKEINKILKSMTERKRQVIDDVTEPQVSELKRIAKENSVEFDQLSADTQQNVLDLFRSAHEDLRAIEFTQSSDKFNSYSFVGERTLGYVSGRFPVEVTNCFEKGFSPCVDTFNRASFDVLSYIPLGTMISDWHVIPPFVYTGAHLQSVQVDYANYMVGEFVQPERIQEIESEFGVEIYSYYESLDREHFQNEDYETLARALAKVKHLRPEDLKKLESLKLRVPTFGHRLDYHIEHMNKNKDEVTRQNGGMVFPREQTIYLSLSYFFGKQRGYRNDIYSDLGVEAERGANLERVLLHELGHVVCQDSDVAFYAEIFSRKKVSDKEVGITYRQDLETFADDYAAYILSEGEKVAKTRFSGQEIPSYNERLSYFKEKFPIHTN